MSKRRCSHFLLLQLPMINALVKKLGAVLVSSQPNIAYLCGYSGFSEKERECFLLFEKNKNYLITDGRYIEAVKKNIFGFELIDIGADNFLSKDHSDILKNLRVIGIEEENLTVSELRKLKKHVKTIKNADLSDLRIIKRDDEIKNIKKACRVADETFSFILGELRTGIKEKEIAGKIESFIKSRGADISFSPIVAFGKNSAFPHHVSGNNKLRSNQIVLLDFGAKVNNYCSDLSRTVFFGKASHQFKKMHKTVLEAQKIAIGRLKFLFSNHKSIQAKDVDKIARQFIIKRGYPSTPHSLGHGVGIEVHEAPHISQSSGEQIRPGMVFSIEPGIYNPSYGGVRIEDLVILTAKGPQLISHARREIIELNYV